MAVFKNSVGIPDQDAINFINATGITSPAELGAVNRLVLDLKGFFNPSYPTANIWTKMKAVYPFVGGTVDTHKFNLKDPRDLDAAYRLTFSGSWTHSSTGVTSISGGSYASTKLDSFNVSASNHHMSLYSRTNNTGTGDMGSWYFESPPSGAFAINFGYANTTPEIYLNYNFLSMGNQGTSAYHLIASRTSFTSLKAYNNGILQATNTNDQSSKPVLRSGEITIAAVSENIGSYRASRNYAFASIGDGLTDTEAANLYTAVQRFQTTLGRQV